MKEQKGITLVSLVIYIVVMVIVITVMGTIITQFQQNTKEVQKDTGDILEFNKFNVYFLKEIKTIGNKVDTIDEKGTYILFKTGNIFSFSNNAIYYNDIEICKNIQNVIFELEKKVDSDGNEKVDNTIINVTIHLKEYSKTIKYKVEEIY